MAFDSASESGRQPTGTIALAITERISVTASVLPRRLDRGKPERGQPEQYRMIDRRLDQRPVR